MYWVSTGFIFRSVNSPFHQLDPRVKLLISIELFSLAILADTPVEVSLLIASILGIATVSKILSRLGRTVGFSAVFAALIFVINLVAARPLIESLVLAFRFVAIIGATSVFFLTTSPDELEYVMKWFKVPRDIVFAFVTAVRFVPVLMMDALQIMDAQKSRGLELEKGNFLTRIRKFVPILVPLVVSAVVRSGELAEAMESRAYGAVEKPTSMFELKLKAHDIFAILLSVLLFILTAYYFFA